jgi:hypothetical protein
MDDVPLGSIVYCNSRGPSAQLRRKHLDYLRSECRQHGYLFDEFIAQPNDSELLATMKDMSESERLRYAAELFRKVDNRLRSLVRSSDISAPFAVRLLHIFQCLRCETSANTTLQHLIKWNEIAALSDDSYYVALFPDYKFDVRFPGADARPTSLWQLDMSFGYMDSVGNAVVIFWDSFRRRCTIDGPTYFSNYWRQYFSGEVQRHEVVLPRYQPACNEHCWETGILAYLARLFVLAHELGHVIVWKQRLSLARRDEEQLADEIGWGLYFSAAQMWIPPFDRLLASGKVRNARERRNILLSDPAFGSMAAIAMRGGDMQAIRAGAGKGSWQLFASDEEMSRAGTINGLIYAVPLAVFRLLDCLEHIARQVHPNGRQQHSYPSATGRIARLLTRIPLTQLAEWIQTSVLPELDRVFPTF